MLKKKETKLIEEMNQLLQRHMKEKGKQLEHAGKLFYAATKENRKTRQGRDVVESAILKQCVGCKSRNGCRFTLEDKDKLGQMMEEQGGLSQANFRQLHPCKRETQFVEEANRIYERELFLSYLEENMLQMQAVIGKQYEEAGQMLGDFGKEMGMSKEEKEESRRIRKGLNKIQINVEGVYTYKNENDRQIYLYLKKKRGKAVATKEVAKELSKALGGRYKVMDGYGKTIDHRYELIGFSMDTNFHVLSGIVSMAYDKNGENGDSISLGTIRESRYVSMISDGMGTGEKAKKESKEVVETMEELLESQVPETRAIQMLEAMSVWRPGKESYATLDYLQIDLFAGIGTFFKRGACPCFLKRKGKTEILSMESLPAGYVKEKEMPFQRKKLENEDMLLQVSDGVIDCLPGNGLETICNYMNEMQVIRPQAFAEQLIGKIMDTEGYEKKDDMTIIAIGIWDK